MTSSDQEQGLGGESLATFAALWAAAILFHQASFQVWVKTPLEVLLGVAAVLVLLKPKALARLALLAGAQVAAVWADLPQVSNHWLFEAFVSVTILVALARARLGAGGGSVDRARLFADLAAPVRWQVVLMYVFAAFHKLNRDYLDPEVSCAAVFSEALSSQLPIVPSGPGMTLFAIFGSLLAEAAIPVFLAVPRLRVVGVALGLLFHLALSLSPYPPQRVYNFSAMLVAVYFLFLPEGVVRGIRDAWLQSRACAWLAREGPGEAVRWSVAALLGVLVTAIALGGKDAFWRSVLTLGPLVLWILYATGALALLLVGYRRASLEPGADAGAFRLASPVLLIGPLLVLLNGLSPYVGGKTETSFAMYSNLRTEGGATNHLLWRWPVPLFGYQEDLVRIRTSSNSKLAWYADSGHVMPWFEFRDFVGRRPHITVVYQRGDEPERTYSKPEDDRRLTPRTWWRRKLLLFRPAKIDGPVVCVH